MQISQKLAERLGLGGEKNFTFFAFCEDFVSVRPCYRLAELVKMAMVCEEEKKKSVEIKLAKTEKKNFYKRNSYSMVWYKIPLQTKKSYRWTICVYKERYIDFRASIVEQSC